MIKRKYLILTGLSLLINFISGFFLFFPESSQVITADCSENQEKQGTAASERSDPDEHIRLTQMIAEKARNKKAQNRSGTEPESDRVFLASSYREALHHLIAHLEKGQFSRQKLALIQQHILNNSEAAAITQALIMSSELTYETKSVLVEMLSVRADGQTMNFATELLQNPDPVMNDLGGDLATLMIRYGKAPQMLESLLWGSYSPETREVIRTVIHSAGNISAQDDSKSEVIRLLDDYVVNGNDAFKPAALTSLAVLKADDQDGLNQLASRYLDDNNEDMRLAAIQTLYNLESHRLGADVRNKLTEISNDTGQSYYIRSAALQILGDFAGPAQKNW